MEQVQVEAPKEKLHFEVCIDCAEGIELQWPDGRTQSTYLKIKFDDHFKHVSTHEVEGKDPKWIKSNDPILFPYETTFGRQNHLKAKNCILEVWNKKSWSRDGTLI
jgi:hypothetical protein